MRKLIVQAVALVLFAIAALFAIAFGSSAQDHPLSIEDYCVNGTYDIVVGITNLDPSRPFKVLTARVYFPDGVTYVTVSDLENLGFFPGTNGSQTLHGFTITGRYYFRTSVLFDDTTVPVDWHRSEVVSGNCFNTPTHQPSVTATPSHTATPTLTLTPTVEPSVTPSATVNPSVTPTATIATVEPSMTPVTPEPTQTAIPELPDSFQGCRIGIGDAASSGYLVGQQASWYYKLEDGTAESDPDLVNQVKLELGMADQEVFLEATYSNMVGGTYVVIVRNEEGEIIAIFTVRACSLVFDELPTQQADSADKPCPTCLDQVCEALRSADSMVLANEHPTTGQLIYQEVSRVEIEGVASYESATGETFWHQGDLKENPAADRIAAGRSVITYYGICSTCILGWGVRRNADGTFEAIYAYGSTAETTGEAIAQAYGYSRQEFLDNYTVFVNEGWSVSNRWHLRPYGVEASWYPVSNPLE